MHTCMELQPQATRPVHLHRPCTSHLPVRHGSMLAPTTSDPNHLDRAGTALSCTSYTACVISHTDTCRMPAWGQPVASIPLERPSPADALLCIGSTTSCLPGFLAPAEPMPAVLCDRQRKALCLQVSRHSVPVCQTVRRAGCAVHHPPCCAHIDSHRKDLQRDGPPTHSAFRQLCISSVEAWAAFPAPLSHCVCPLPSYPITS